MALPPSHDVVLREEFGVLQVTATIAGRWSGWFVLDTGSYRSFLTEEAVRRLERIGFHAGREDGLTSLRLTIGETSLGTVSFARLPKDYGQAVAGVGALGVIGLDQLSRYAIGLDVGRHTLRLMPKADDTARAGWFSGAATHRAPLIEDDEGMFRTRIEIGDVTAPLLLDTGVSDTEVAPVLFDRIGPKRSMASQTERFFDGLHTVRYASVPRLRLNGVTLGGPFKIGAVAYNVHTGFVGLALLRRLRVLIDYPGHLVFFTGGAAGPLPRWRFAQLARPRLTPRQGTPFRGGVRKEPKGGFRIGAGWDVTVPRLWSIVDRRDGDLELIPPSRQKN